MNKADYNKTLQLTEQKANIIESQVRENCAEIQRHALTAAEAFYADLVVKTPLWIQQAQCQTSISNVFKVKKQAEEYTRELVDILSDHVREETESWVKGRFVPLIKSDVQTLAETVDAETTACFKGLDHLRVSLDVNQQSIVDHTTPSTANRVLSSGASLMIGDIGGAIMGGAGGFDATLKTLGCEFVAGLVLGIIALFNPIGLTAFVLSMVAAIITGGAWSMSSLEKSIRKKVAEETVKTLKADSQREKFNQTIKTKVDELLGTIRASVDERLRQLRVTTNAYRMVG